MMLLSGLVSLCLAFNLQAFEDQASELKSSETEQTSGINQALFFESRFKLNSAGKPDLASLSECRTMPSSLIHIEKPEILTSQVVVKPQIKKRKIDYQSAPEISRQRTHLLGNVKVTDAKSIISAEEVLLDHDKQYLLASGGVSIESKEAFFSANSLETNANNETNLTNASFVLFGNNANGNAETIKVNALAETDLTNLTFTTCPIGNDSWQFATSEMNIDPESGRGEAWNTTLRVGGIPVFYFPYINFPTDDRRKSGLLTPAIKTSDSNGLDISQPVYWNIAPSMDAEFFFRQIEKRGDQIGAEYRWLTEKTLAEWEFEWINKDKQVSALLENNTQNTPLAYHSEERWLNQLMFQAAFSDLWHLKVDTKRVSDSEYFRDFGSGLDKTNETQLTSQMNLSFLNENWDINLFSRTYQSLIGNEAYRYLPGFNLNGDYLAESGLYWQLKSEWDNFEHKNINKTQGSRFNIQPSLSYPVNLSWGFFNPKISYQSSHYQQESQLTGAKQTITRNLPIVSFDSGLFFDRKMQLDGENYTHSLSPRFFYSYIPYRNQQAINLFDTALASFNFDSLWQENRFTGTDRVGDTNHVSLAIANSLIKDGDNNPLFNFSLGRKFYLQESKVHLNGVNLDMVNNKQSPWLADLTFNINQYTDLQGFIEWDDKSSSTNQAKTKIKFEPIANHIVNVTHRYRKVALIGIEDYVSEEADISFAWPINDQWRLVGRRYNDLLRKQTIETLFGVEYESCCWAIRLVAQKYLNSALDSFGMPITMSGEQYDQGIQVQFVFKGLGSAGNAGLSDLLESSIAGYQDPFLH